MQVSSLSDALIQNLKDYPVDKMIEKHEKTHWDSYLTERTLEMWSNGELITVTSSVDVEFLHTNGLYILLPVPTANHENITINQCIVSDDKQSVVLFLNDRTYFPDDEIDSRFMAVCRKIPECDGYICCLYHSTYLQRLG